MKKRLFRFYLMFLIITLGLLSCENGSMGLQSKEVLERRPLEPHRESVEGESGGKKAPKTYVSRMSSWC